DEVFAVALQADGKIVAAGSYVDIFGTAGHGFALARYNTNGTLDPSFGVGGVVLGLNLGAALALAIQGDGKIVVTGSSGADVFSNADVALARYNPDGTPDIDFGCGTPGTCSGIVLTDFGPGRDEGRSLAIQADGKIVLTGGDPSGDYFGLARYNPNGSPDASFGTGGLMTTPLGGFGLSEIEAVALALNPSDGKIVLAARSGAFVLARYNTDGSLDTSF